MIPITFSNICNKTYEKTYRFFYIFWNFYLIFTYLQNFMISNLCPKKCPLFQYVNKSLHIPATLNNIFDKIMKNSDVFATWFSSLFQFLDCHAVLLRLHFYHKNDSCFNVAENCFLFQRAYFLSYLFKMFFYLSFTFPNVCNLR